MSAYYSQAARDAQRLNYGDHDYRLHLDQSAQSKRDHYARNGRYDLAQHMMTRSLAEALRGNEGA
jgi:hypothetical protein